MPAPPSSRPIRGARAVRVAVCCGYTYFPDKATPGHSLVERLLGGVDHGIFADDRRPWRHRVEAVALELREQLASHPGAVASSSATR